MSANRSVQAAQRRRAGGPEPAAPGRGPQPSINSSQMFSGQGQGQQQQQQQQQIRPGTTGRLAGQQAQVQQQQMQQQQKQQMQNPMQQSGENGVSKITIAQAITLTTLRLGKVEMQLYELAHQMEANGSEQGFSGQGVQGAEGMEDMVLIDKNLIDSIMSRLESLEKRSPTNNAVGTGSSADITLLKQQFDAIKPSIANNTKVTTALTKEQKEHKVIVDGLRFEMANTKDLLAALQTMSMDNSQKIFQIMSGEEVLAHNDEEDDEEVDSGIHFSDVAAVVEESDESEELDGLEITGTNLKGLIEQELNA